MHIFLMDIKNQNNYLWECNVLREAYKNFLTIRYYIGDYIREDILKLKGYPFILIMSSSSTRNKT